MITVAQSRTTYTATKISNVGYCNLIQNNVSYHKKRVRVRAIFTVGFEAHFLYNTECQGEVDSENRVWVEFASDYEKFSKPEIIKRFEDFLKPSKRLDGSINMGDGRRVEVLVVGRFESGSYKYGHVGSYDYQITIESIEEVKSVSDNTTW
jgi:hypothetical protein